MTGAWESASDKAPHSDGAQGAVSAVFHRLNGLTRLPVAAREFALAGVPVFPCVPSGKRPLTEHGFRDAWIAPGIVESLIQQEGWAHARTTQVLLRRP